jgi:hypothetical protein
MVTGVSVITTNKMTLKIAMTRWNEIPVNCAKCKISKKYYADAEDIVPLTPWKNHTKLVPLFLNEI